MALVRDWKVEPDDGYDPAVIDDENCLKNAREVPVIVREPCLFQT